MKKSKFNASMFIAFFVILWAVFLLVPFINSFILSFQSCKGAVCSFNGVNNYVRLAGDEVFITTLKNTLTYLIVQVPIMLFLGLIFANMLNNPNLKFKGFFRTAFFLPAVTSLVGYSVVFKLMFSNEGIVNSFLINSGIIESQIQWITDPFWAKILIIMAITWRWTGYNMIFYLAAMQNISNDIYEAAKIDGAGSIQTFFKVTLPQLKPVILFTTVMSTIGTLQLFDEVVNITQGGPGYATMTLSQYIYDLSFSNIPNFGYAASVSYVIVTIVVLLSILQKKVAGD